MSDWKTIVPQGRSPFLRQGKRDALDGKPMPPRGQRGMNMEQEHLYRMGHIVASGQRARHPDWSDEFIMW